MANSIIPCRYKTKTVTGTTNSEGRLNLGISLPNIVKAVYENNDWREVFPVLFQNGSWSAVVVNGNTITPAGNITVTLTVYYE